MSSDIPSIIEAKKYYTNQLCKFLQPQIYKGLASIWALCKNSDEPLKNFQIKLEHISKWNSMIIDDEYQRIVEETGCNYIEKLIDTIFIANARILSTLNNNNKHLNITVPPPKKFLHFCYINCAYHFYSDPFLFDDRDKSATYRKRQKNIRDIMDVINTSISDTIENLLPLEELLERCLNKEEDSDEDSRDEDMSIPIPAQKKIEPEPEPEQVSSEEGEDAKEEGEDSKRKNLFRTRIGENNDDVFVPSYDRKLDDLKSDEEDDRKPDLNVVEGENIHKASKNIHLLVNDDEDEEEENHENQEVDDEENDEEEDEEEEDLKIRLPNEEEKREKSQSFFFDDEE